MPTPAEVLLENSTLQSGTPWEHLNAQEGGGTEGTFMVSSTSVEIVDDSVSVELKEQVIGVEILE